MKNKTSAAGQKVLVTGAAGFVGRALCERLLADGLEVTGLDSYFAGTRPNIEHLCRHARFAMYHGDMVNPGFIDRRFDQIFDLSGWGGPTFLHDGSINGPKGDDSGGLGLLALAERSGARILRASSGWRHHAGPHPCSIHRQEPSAVLENLLVKEVRIFNAYGPEMSLADDHAIPRFIANALRGEPIVIDGDGCQIRSFCFIDDVIDGLIQIMASPEDLGGPVDLGSSESCMILDLVNMIIEATGTSSTISFEPDASTGPAWCLPNLSRTKAHLGWSASMPIRIGLAETIDYFEDMLSRGRARQPLGRPMPISLQSSVA